MYSKILMGTDGSSTATAAVRFGAEIAKIAGAKAVILHVGNREDGEKILERAAQEADSSAETITVPGDPAHEILEVADRERADLIVVGNKGMTGAKRFLIGSVPNQVSHHAQCDVLIVKTT